MHSNTTSRPSGREFSSFLPPSSFAVGSKTLPAPFVQADELKAHLCLLRAFRDLRNKVEGGNIAGWSQLARRMAPHLRWKWFVGLAVERFQLWLCTTRVTLLDLWVHWVEQELPPLDVLMVWHAYMLNPSWYAEDLTRIESLRPLSILKDRLLTSIVRLGDISKYEHSAARDAIWVERTGTPFDPLVSASAATTHTVKCPRCLSDFPVYFITAKETGYLQPEFWSSCPSCNCRIDKDCLALLKFARDITRNPDDPEDVKQYGAGVYLAGTLRSTEKSADVQKSRRITQQIQQAFIPPKEVRNKNEWTRRIPMAVNYSLNEMHKRIATALYGDGQRIKRISSAYQDDLLFSVDLVTAVLLQFFFIDKLDEYGWINQFAFESQEDKHVLSHCIARYHAFADLISSAPGTCFVPTLDIDLAWLTHQLKGEIYHANCMEYMRHYVDQQSLFTLLRHDHDVIDKNSLATSFADTCHAWQARFQVPYTHCSCPLPENTRLSPSEPHSGLLHPHPLQAALIPPDRPDALAATHTSEHNGVHLQIRCAEDAMAARQAREARIRERRTGMHHLERMSEGGSAERPGEERLDDLEEWAKLELAKRLSI